MAMDGKARIHPARNQRRRVGPLTSTRRPSANACSVSARAVIPRAPLAWAELGVGQLPYQRVVEQPGRLPLVFHPSFSTPTPPWASPTSQPAPHRFPGRARRLHHPGLDLTLHVPGHPRPRSPASAAARG
jgi:hypothetical protein